jgi:hypothetical protein
MSRCHEELASQPETTTFFSFLESNLEIDWLLAKEIRVEVIHVILRRDEQRNVTFLQLFLLFLMRTTPRLRREKGYKKKGA